MDIRQILDPTNTALIIVDKQAAYFDPQHVAKRHQTLPDDSAQILASIDSFIHNARKANVKIIWTQMVEDVDLSPSHIASKMRADPRGITTVSRPDDTSFEIIGSTLPNDDEKIIVKYYYDAFAKTNLTPYLASNDIRNVIIIGGYASRCLLATAVGANGAGLTCIVPKGLIINQARATSEIETVYSAVDAIYGAVLEPEEILSYWNNL